jgi:epidermal growth factor receptor substrate 15
MTAAVFDQDTFEGRNDDVGLNSGTFNGGGGPGGDWTQDTGVNFRVRFLIQETNGGMAPNQQFALYYEKNGDGNPTGSSAVTTSSSNVILVNDTQGINDNETTTQVIGGGTYVSGDSLGYDDGTSDVGTGNIDFTANTECEVEFCIQIVGADVSDADTIDLYVFEADATQLGSYTDSPRVTAKKPLAVSESDSATPGESSSVVVSAPQVSASESINVVDIPRYYPDAIIIGEAATVEVTTPEVGDLSISESDSATPGESATVSPLELAGISESDSATPDESVNVVRGEATTLTVSEADAVSVGESASTVLSDPQISEAEAVSVGESSTVAVGAEPDLEVSEADAVTVVDSPTYYSEAIAVGEHVTVAVVDPAALTISETESATPGESTSAITSDPQISETDSAAPDESVTIATSALQISATDSATPGESVDAITSAPQISESEAISVGEANVTLEVGALQPQEINESEAVSVGESSSATVSAPQISETDVVSVGDSASVATEALLISEAEAVSLGESDNLELVYHVGVSDAATTSDAATVDPLLFEVIESETISTADAATLAASAPQVTATDAVSVADSISVSLPGYGDLNVDESETISLGESTDFLILIEVDEGEAISLGETATTTIPGYVLLGSLNYAYVPFDDWRAAVEYEEDRASVPFEDHRSGA